MARKFKAFVENNMIVGIGIPIPVNFLGGGMVCAQGAEALASAVAPSGIQDSVSVF
jgi:hypothetical protein